MNAAGWMQLVIFVACLFVLTKPMGLFLVAVLDAAGKTFLDPVVKPIERLIYRILRVDPLQEQDWKQYSVSMLIFSAVSMFFTYAILRCQSVLPLNPQGLPDVGDHLSFNTAASFTTNTNWQSYGGESTMSYLSQMVALTVHNFLSAAVGIAIAAVIVRGIARHGAKTIGNFWADLVRLNLYLLLPACIVYAVFLVSQGMIQNFKPYDSAKSMEPYKIQVARKNEKGEEVKQLVQKKDEKGEVVKNDKGEPVMEEQTVMEDQTVDTQSIVQGPMASQVAIKMLGTNGGGYVNANASHPYENPTPFSNFIQMLSIFLIPSALTWYLGKTVGKQAHGWAVWAAMLTLFLAGVLVCWHYEAAGNPRFQEFGIDAASGNMEGKEVRFGIFNSALFATITTGASCGAVNSMHDSFTPLGGLVPLINIQLGEVVFGGVGAGLYGILVFIVVTIFISGLMIGRTPEYLGKKIESYDVKVASLAILAMAFSILIFTAWSASTEWGKAGLNNSGPHGLSEILYAYTSGTGNNGSAFAGLTANAPGYDTTLAFAMLIGRFFMIIPVLALAGNMARKKRIPENVGSFPVAGPTFVLLLTGTIIIVGALTFLPALALGPIVEHFIMHGSKTLF